MSFLGIDNIADLLKTVVERVVTDPKQRDEAQLKLLELQQTGELAQLAAEKDLNLGQIEINKIEAANGNLFVSGWRPAVGWMGALGYFYNFFMQPLIVLTFQIDPKFAPPIDMGELGLLMATMLGMGSLRTIDKRYSCKNAND